jgi:hypothetical protein
LYYADFTDKLKKRQHDLDITVLSGNSPKSVFFMKQMLLSDQKCGIVEAQNLPCFIISDRKELLIAFHEQDATNEAGNRKFRTVAIWTNYSAFVWTLQILFSKLLETLKD